jgi:outer membrane lipoprotein carrier protein
VQPSSVAFRALLLCLVVSVWTGVAAAGPAAAADRPADDGYADLLAFQNRVRTLRARFEQTLLDEHGEAVQHSSGTFYLARPARFRWDYSAPSEQLIVGDGTSLWLYDADLEQVTVRPLSRALGNSAALLLSAQRPLDRDFIVEPLPTQDGLRRVRLRPKDPSVSFVDIRLGFKGGDPRRMELLDKLGQTTRLELSSVERNPDLPEATFRFVPPPGADVIRSE